MRLMPRALRLLVPARSRLLAVGLALATALGASAQPGTWASYPAYQEVTAVAASSDAIWAGTSAGVFAVSTDGAFERYTTVDGLFGGDIRAIAVDDAGIVWVGYVSGAIDRIDPATGDIAPLLDIARATQFASRTINRIRPDGGRLLVATDFGFVVLDADRREVRASASRLADLLAATPVNDVMIAPLPDGSGDGYWLATDGGVVTAPITTDNLQNPASWTRLPGWEGEATALVQTLGSAWVAGRPQPTDPGDLYRVRDDGSFTRSLFVDNTFRDLLATPEGRVAAVSVDRDYLLLFEPGVGAHRQITSPSAGQIQSGVLGPDGRVWTGDAQAGLFAFPAVAPGTPAGTTTVGIGPVAPEGPYTNQLVGLGVDGQGAVWVTSETVRGAAGVSVLDEGEWRTFTNADPGLPQNGFSGLAAREEGGAIFGSLGDGLAVIDPDGTFTTYREGNSTLLPSIGTTDFIVVSDAAEDGDGWWVINKGSPRPLQLFPGTTDATLADWTALPPPSAFPSGAIAERITIDTFGQKWISLNSRGLLVWDTGADPRDPADDRGRLFNAVGTNGQDLPNGFVTATVADREGRLWIGTKRGLAIIFSPGSAFGGDPALATPQWARTADGTSYLLRDVEVTDLDLDPAGSLWVSTTTGAFLLTPEGDGVALQLRAEGTPLISDAILSLAVDDESGEVFMLTPTGLFGYAAEATGPTPGSEALRLAPNPFRPAEHDGVRISDLAAPVSRVRVLSLDGRVLFEDDAVFGGAFRWDGRDRRTGEMVPSGVYIVAASGANGEGTIYGKLAVLR